MQATAHLKPLLTRSTGTTHTSAKARLTSAAIWQNQYELECGPMPNVMAALPNIGGGALCSTPQSLADALYWSVVQ